MRAAFALLSIIGAFSSPNLQLWHHVGDDGLHDRERKQWSRSRSEHEPQPEERHISQIADTNNSPCSFSTKLRDFASIFSAQRSSSGSTPDIP